MSESHYACHHCDTLSLSADTHLLYSNHWLIVILMNSWPSSLKWQSVTFRRNWPVSPGAVSADSEFAATKSFKKQLKGQRLVEGGDAHSSRMSNPWSFACSLLDNWSSIYSPVITGLVPAPWADHLFLVSLLPVCFQLCSQLFTSGPMIRNLFLVLQSVVYDWFQGQRSGCVVLQPFFCLILLIVFGLI